MKNIRVWYFFVVLSLVLFSNQDRIVIFLLFCFFGVIILNKKAFVNDYATELEALVDLYNVYVRYAKINQLRLAKEYLFITRLMPGFTRLYVSYYVALRGVCINSPAPIPLFMRNYLYKMQLAYNFRT